MALDLQNSKANQNKSSVSGAKAGVSPGAPLTSSTTSAGAQVEITKPAPTDPPSQFELRPPRFWLVLAILVVAAAVGMLVLYLRTGSKKSNPDQSQKQAAALSSPVSHETPKPPPPVSNADDKKALGDYFSKVSTNFKPEYLDKIPQVAAEAFKKYQAASGDAKLDTARTFYVYLNAPGVAGDDPIYGEFVKDVKDDLEKTLGKKLF